MAELPFPAIQPNQTETSAPALNLRRNEMGGHVHIKIYLAATARTVIRELLIRQALRGEHTLPHRPCDPWLA